ncbi:hypothetical protein Tco_0405520 [Tanacetum coccineum]
MDANKKIDLENLLCPNESKLLANILQNHPLRFNISVSSSVPWIYLGQFWHTLKEDGSKYKLSFVFDRKELTMTPGDFRTIFHLPQATDNNHDHFVHALNFLEMVLFYINNLSFTLKSRSPSNFKTTSLVQPWQTMCKMFSRCLTTQVTGYDQPPLQIMQMILHFLKSRDGLVISIIILEDDEMVKSIFNSGKNKKIHEDLEAKQNEEKDKEHLMAEEIEKLVEGTENLEENEESPKVEITDVVQPVNVNEDEEESAMDDYELKRREKGKHVEESRNTPSPTTIRSPRIHSTLLQGRYRYLFEHLKTRFKPRKKFYDLAQHLQEVMEESLPKMVDTHAIQQECKNLWAEISSQINNVITNHIPSQFDSSVRNYMSRHILHDDLLIWLALKYKFERLHMSDTSCRPSAVRLRDHDDPHDDAHSEGENSAKRQKTSEHGIYVFEESSSGQDNKSEPDDDVLPTEKVSQELVKEMSQTVDEAKLCKVVNETLRQ